MYAGVFGSRQSEASYQDISSQATLQITTSSWNAIPATSTIDTSRLAITLDVPSNNVNGAVIWFQTSASSPTVAITSGVYISPGAEPWTISIPYTIKVWARSLGSATTSFNYIEWK